MVLIRGTEVQLLERGANIIFRNEDLAHFKRGQVWVYVCEDGEQGYTSPIFTIGDAHALIPLQRLTNVTNVKEGSVLVEPMNHIHIPMHT